jgi:hypothetical protein
MRDAILVAACLAWGAWKLWPSALEWWYRDRGEPTTYSLTEGAQVVLDDSTVAYDLRHGPLNAMGQPV